MSYYLSWLATGLLFGLWMYFDAKARKLEQPSTWIWVGSLFGLLGLFTYWYWHVYPNNKARKK